MKTIIPCFIAVAAFCFAGLAPAETIIGSGNVISETRSVSGFHGVKLSGSGDVIVTQGDTEGLVVEAEDNILPLVETTVGENGILHLGFKDHAGHVETHKGVIFKLSVKTLDQAMVAGSGSLHAAVLSTDHLNLVLPGSGEITVDQLKADTVHSEIEGSGTVKLAGEAHSQKVELNGSGDYKAKKFKTDAAAVAINGSGDVQVWANESLAVAVNGSGEVGYSGNPKVTKNVNGSGEVHALGAEND